MSPTLQTLRNEGVDVDIRTTIDIYEQAMKNVAMEYGIPVIDGNEIAYNFGNDMAIDAYHFTKDGFRAIGYKMASYFIGQSPNYPVVVHSGSYLGVHPNIDNVNIALPTVYDNTDKSPNIPYTLNSDDLYVNVDRNLGGLQANVTGAGSITWSFYCPQEGMVIIPSFYTKDDMDVTVKLDFGAKQGKWTNYWNYVATTESINREHVESAEITIQNAQMTTWGAGKVYSLHTVTTSTSPVIKVTSKGWHTLQITPKLLNPKNGDIALMSDIPEDWGNGLIEVFGLNFLSMDDYKRKIGAQ